MGDMGWMTLARKDRDVEDAEEDGFEGRRVSEVSGRKKCEYCFSMPSASNRLDFFNCEST